MPHNWASAECVRYLRHMLLLEDGPRMRFLEGMIPSSFDERRLFRLENTPTRFGRVTLQNEPVADRKGWKLDVTIEPAQRAESVEVPVSIAGRQFDRVLGAKSQIQGRKVEIDPDGRKWTAIWR